MNISLFGPLSKSYCELFNYLGIFLIIMFAFYTVSILYLIFLFPTIKGKFLAFLMLIMFMILIGIKYVFLGLLYNMCKNAK